MKLHLETTDYLFLTTLPTTEHAAIKASHLCFDRIMEICGLAERSADFKYTETMKPYLESPLHFSISHCASTLIIGLSLLTIGVDCEYRVPRQTAAIQQRYFNDAERLQISQAPCPLREFYQIWCTHEATSKYSSIPILEYYNHRIPCPGTLTDVFAVENLQCAVVHHHPLVIIPMPDSPVQLQEPLKK